MRSRGATGIIAKGFINQQSSTFRLEDKGAIISIKLSPNQKVLSIQRNKSTVEFFNGKPYFSPLCMPLDSSEQGISIQYRISIDIGIGSKIPDLWRQLPIIWNRCFVNTYHRVLCCHSHKCFWTVLGFMEDWLLIIESPKKSAWTFSATRSFMENSWVGFEPRTYLWDNALRLKFMV